MQYKISNEITILYEEILLHKSKSVCFTSSTSKEGTTTVACALAIAAALQQKVLYCDFTNYVTSLSKKFGKTFQSTNDSPLEQIFNNIYPLEKQHFDLMPLPAPLIHELMVEGFLTALFDQLGQQYDLIIIDSNGFHRYKESSLPTSSVSSAADSTILVVLSGGVSEVEVQQTVNSIIDGGGKLIGIVMNDIQYPRVVDELCELTHYFDKFAPELSKKIREKLRASVILNTEN